MARSNGDISIRLEVGSIPTKMLNYELIKRAKSKKQRGIACPMRRKQILNSSRKLMCVVPQCAERKLKVKKYTRVLEKNN